MKKVYDTIQLSRAAEVSFQLSQSSVEDNPGFDVAKAQECAASSTHLSAALCDLNDWSIAKPSDYAQHGKHVANKAD